MSVSRILHFRVRATSFSAPEMKGGATVLLTGDVNGVKVQVAYCNPSDVFNKKLGREYAAQSAGSLVTLRELPGVLGTIYKQVFKRAKVPLTHRVNFDSKIRDFLPKE